jgi:hypothetical protein
MSASPIVAQASENTKLPQPNVHAAQPRDFFALSIATSAGELRASRSPILDALELSRVFREDFGVRFNQHIICSDAAPPAAAQDTALSLRGASLGDIQRALQDLGRCLSASHKDGKQLSLLLHLNMQLSAQDNASAGEGAGSSDALVGLQLPRDSACATL